jgi:hypothetical protein
MAPPSSSVRIGKAEVNGGRAPKYDSPFMKQLADKDPWIDPLGPDSALAKAYNGIKPSPASFDIPKAPCESRRLPSLLETNRTGAKMSFRVMGNPVATRLLIDVKIGGADNSREHETRLEFYPGMAGHVKDLHYEAIWTNSTKDEQKQRPHRNNCGVENFGWRRYRLRDPTYEFRCGDDRDLGFHAGIRERRLQEVKGG